MTVSATDQKGQVLTLWLLILQELETNYLERINTAYFAHTWHTQIIYGKLK